MTFEKRQELLHLIRDAGKRNARLELMRIVAEYPIDYASAMSAFREGLEYGESPSGAIVPAAAAVE